MNFFKKVFSIRHIDNHIICMLMGVQIKIKTKTSFECPIVKDFGVTKTKRTTRIIASLTTYPERIEAVQKTISTLLTQTLKPDEVVLWLAESQFPNRELPQGLLDLQQYGLTIEWTEDIRSYKKLIPALAKFPEDIIITFDDDIYYAENTIETLYNSYQKYPQDIHAHRCGKVYLNHLDIKDISMRKLYFEKFDESMFSIRQIGYGGVLYPPHCMHNDCCNTEIFRSEIPTHDDIWFWVMAVINGTKIRSVKGYEESVNYVENSQSSGLCKINKNSGNGGSVEEAIKKMQSRYPELYENLIEELDV